MKIIKKKEDIYILDNNTIIYNQDTSILQRNIYNLLGLSENTLNGEESVIRNINGEKTILSKDKSDVYNWTYLSKIPLTYYQDRLDGLFSSLKYFVLISLVLVIIVSLVITFIVYKPILNLISILEKPAKWKKNISSNKVMKLMDFNKKMEEEFGRRLTLLKRSQIIALQSQINPHFLFNTLETIRWESIIKFKGENSISDMISHLADLVRLGYKTENNLITIEKEIEHAKRYIEIQKFCYKDKFTVNWQIDPRILKFKILKITLQPLIENAIKYGIKQKKEAGIIKIKAYRLKDDIKIEVSDNGIGISPERVEELNNYLKEQYDENDEHLGLRNVNQRIKIIFGEEYGITINSKQEVGTIVHVLMPVKK